MTGYDWEAAFAEDDEQVSAAEPLTFFTYVQDETPVERFRHLPEGSEVPIYDSSGTQVGVAVMGAVEPDEQDRAFTIRVPPGNSSGGDAQTTT